MPTNDKLEAIIEEKIFRAGGPITAKRWGVIRDKDGPYMIKDGTWGWSVLDAALLGILTGKWPEINDVALQLGVSRDWVLDFMWGFEGTTKPHIRCVDDTTNGAYELGQKFRRKYIPEEH